jgi:hypothetical protein
MSIKDIISTLSPPVHPYDQPSKQGWEDLEKRIETTLPGDYKDFIETFGSGAIDNFIWVFNPFSKNPNLNLEQQFQTKTKILAELQTYGEDVPYQAFPKQDGIFPFAVSDNGDVLYWRTTADPQQWKVIVNEARGPDWEAFDLSMTEFLGAILSRRLICNIFPDDFPRDAPKFSPGQ